MLMNKIQTVFSKKEYSRSQYSYEQNSGILEMLEKISLPMRKNSSNTSKKISLQQENQDLKNLVEKLQSQIE